MTDQFPNLDTTSHSPSRPYRRRKKSPAQWGIAGCFIGAVAVAAGFLLIGNGGDRNRDSRADHQATKNTESDRTATKARPTAKEWLQEFSSIFKQTDDNREIVRRMEQMGFILDFDHEARNVIVDHFGWTVLSQIDQGRWLATTTISEEMAYRQNEDDFAEPWKAREVTLFSSETGQSLSWRSPLTGEVSIFR